MLARMPDWLAGSAWQRDRHTDGLKKQAMNYRTSSASSRDKRVVKNVVLLIFLHILLYLYK